MARQFLVTTTGTQNPVVIADLGSRSIAHPTTDLDLALEYSAEEIVASADLQSAITSGYITAEDENSNSITNIATQAGGVTSFNSRAGAVEPTSGDYAVADLGSGTLSQLNSVISDATLDDSSDPRDPTSHALGGAAHSTSTLSQLNAKISDATLDDSSAARTPTTHASSHNAGGGDALAIDAAAGTGSLRTLGTSSTSACAGNDSRLSDARTPTAHASSHSDGGSDEISVEDLATSASDTSQVLRPDGAGGLAFGADTGGQEIYDAIVAASGGDYTSVAAAFAAGKKSVYVRKGTYVETADVVLTDGCRLHGEVGAIIYLNGSYSVKVDGSGGTQETTGTIAVTNGSTQVTGTSTTFTNLSAGDYILIDTTFYEIDSITSDTVLDLTLMWEGATESGLSYIAQTMVNVAALQSIIITGSSSVGLYIRGGLAVSLNNVVITGCANNVQIINSGSISMLTVLSRDSAGVGLSFDGVYGSGMVNAASYNNNGAGFYFTGCSGFFVASCNASGNDGNGFDVTGSSTKVTLTTCGSSQNNGKGFNVDSGVELCTINACLCRGNGSEGIDIDGSENVVVNCAIRDNGANGIQCGISGLIASNQISNNTSNGIMIGYDADVLVDGNIIYDNGNYGINTEGTGNTNCIVSNNRIYDNTGNIGIRIASGSTGWVLSGNLVTGHTTNISNLESTTKISVDATGTPAAGNLVRHNGTNPAWTSALTGLTTASFTEYQINGGSAVTGNFAPNFTTNGQKQMVVLGASVSITSLTFPGAGNYILRIVQDGTGSRVLTWPAAVQAPGGKTSGLVLSTGAGAVDVAAIYYDGSTARVVLSKNFAT